MSTKSVKLEGNRECRMGAQTPFEYYGPLIDNYAPLYKILMRGNHGHDEEDLRQEISLKFVRRFKDESDWEKVDNPRAYLVRTARNMASTLAERSPVNHESLDDEENLEVRLLSDEGTSCAQINIDIDNKPLLIQIDKILKDNFSEYERLLIQLNFIEGCKPAHIAEILLWEYPDILEEKYSEMLEATNGENRQLLKRVVGWDCNRVKAKFSQELKKSIVKGDINRL